MKKITIAEQCVRWMKEQKEPFSKEDVRRLMFKLANPTIDIDTKVNPYARDYEYRLKWAREHRARIASGNFNSHDVIMLQYYEKDCCYFSKMLLTNPNTTEKIYRGHGCTNAKNLVESWCIDTEKKGSKHWVFNKELEIKSPFYRHMYPSNHKF